MIFRPNETAKHRLKVVALLLAVLAAGACMTWWIVSRADREMRASLLQETQMVAQAVGVERVQALSGTEADLASPAYQRLKEQLVTSRSINPLCRFIYLLGRKPDGTIFIFVDSEPATSKDYSPPGQVYDEAPAGSHRAFATRTEIVEGPVPDRWGNWISAMVPILEQAASPDKASGRVLAVFGMDIDARDWIRMLVLSGVPPVLLTLALALILLAGSTLLERRAWSGARPPRQIRNIGLALVAASGTALTLFASWMAHDRENHGRDEAFRRLAASRTAAIAEMMRKLRDTELEGLAHFCETSPAAAAEEFKRYTGYLIKDPAIQAWEWIPAVAAADRPRFEGEARAAGWKGFEIWQNDAQGKRVPAAERDFYYPVFQVAPLAGNERAVGYDTGSEPRRRAALEEAARTGLATGTDPITLVQEAGDQKGMLIYRPVFSGENPRHLLGFAMAVLRMGTLLGAEDTAHLLPMQLSLLRKDAAPELLASTGDAGGPPVARLSVKRPVFAFGKVFAVTASPEREFLFLGHHPVQESAQALLIGLLLTSALALLAGVLLRRREELELAQEALLKAHLELEERVKNRTGELNQSKAQLQLLLDSTAEAIYGIDTHGDCTFCNSACLRMLGYESEDELLGKNMHWQIHHKHADGTHFPVEECRIFRAFLANEGSHVDDEVLWRADGSSFPAEYWSYPQRVDGVAVGAVVTFTDITKRKRAEGVVLENLARAEELARLKSRFVSMASHELRTPLANVMLASELLKNFGNDMPAERSQSVLSDLKAGVFSMVRTIDDLLLAGTLEEGKLPFTPARFLLLDFLRRCCLEVQPELPSRIEIAFRDAGLAVTADEQLLQRIMKNLLENALKYSPDDTRVEIGAEAGPNSLTLSVLDRGIGVPEAEREFLFDAFSRASNVGDKPGSGLGLFIAQKCAQAHGGTIRYTPQPDGSLFSVTVPLSALSATADLEPTT